MKCSIIIFFIWREIDVVILALIKSLLLFFSHTVFIIFGTFFEITFFIKFFLLLVVHFVELLSTTLLRGLLIIYFLVIHIIKKLIIYKRFLYLIF